MKSIAVLLSCFFLSSLTLRSQAVVIDYHATFHLSKVLPNLSKEQLAVLENSIAIYRFAAYKQKSIYQYVSNRRINPDIAGGFKPNILVTYKDFMNHQLYLTNADFPDVVGKDSLTMQNKWEIQPNDQRIIAGYTCQKAVNNGTENVTLWFTCDIPLSDGPHSFYGLPGQILMVESPMMTLKAEKVELPDYIPEIDMPKADQYVSREVFNKLTRKK